VSWIETTLGKSFELYQPKTITTKDLIEDGKYLVYGANGVIGRYDKFNHEEPQLLITCRGATCGAVNVSSPYAWINGNAMVVKPKSKDVDVRFIEYFFRGAVDLSRAITGAAQPQITRQSLSPIVFKYPPLSTQKRIVAKLDSIFAEIDKTTLTAEANAKNAESLFESYLNQVFERGGDGWIITVLDNVCKVDRGSSPRPIKEYFTENDDGVNWIKIGDTEEGGKYIFSTNQKITKAGAEKSRYVEVGDFILTNSMSYGRPYIMRINGYIHDGWFGDVPFVVEG
jgi:type I restriction enzyme S subunit